MLRKQQEPEQSNLTSSQDNNNNSPSSTPSQTRPLPEITPRAYKPKEFQGALGKVSVSSIVAPRKMIDIPLSSEGGGKETVVGNIDGYMKKKQALIIIEKVRGCIGQKLYNCWMKVILLGALITDNWRVILSM